MPIKHLCGNELWRKRNQQYRFSYPGSSDLVTGLDSLVHSFNRDEFKTIKQLKRGQVARFNDELNNTAVIKRINNR